MEWPVFVALLKTKLRLFGDQIQWKILEFTFAMYEYTNYDLVDCWLIMLYLIYVKNISIPSINSIINIINILFFDFLNEFWLQIDIYLYPSRL